jgi:hypothetical protein
MIIAEEEQHDHRSDGGTEAHSGGEQPDNVNRTNSREAWTARHIVKGDASHERDEQGNQKFAPIAQGTPCLGHPARCPRIIGMNV